MNSPSGNLLGIMLLYVGAVLVINGIWLIGQARTARAPAGSRWLTAPDGPLLGDEAERFEQSPQASGGAVAVRAHPSVIQNREVAVVNLFTGGLGVALSIVSFVVGAVHNNLADFSFAGFVLLFAFTYLWVAANQFLNAGGHAFGWYCFFVAVTAVPTGVLTLLSAAGHVGSVWLGIDWLAWAVLWFMFFLLLALELPIARITGYVTVLVGVATSWALGYGLLQGRIFM
ncbi:MAG: AmiS/UreI family transporter [Acidimicrobiales bacterium]